MFAVFSVMDVDYSPTGREFVSAGYDKMIRIFPVDKGRSRYEAAVGLKNIFDITTVPMLPTHLISVTKLDGRRGGCTGITVSVCLCIQTLSRLLNHSPFCTKLGVVVGQCEAHCHDDCFF